MKKSSFRLRVVIAICGLLFVSFSFYVYQILFTPNFLIDKGDKATDLLIPQGATIQTVKDSLIKKELLHDQKSFFFLTRLMGYNEKVKPGRYIIEPKSSNLQVIRKLKRAEQSPIRLTFNNIRLKSELCELLGDKMEFSSEEMDSLMNDTTFVGLYGFDTTTILTMFIPNTYEVYWNTPARKLFDRMHDEYKKFWSDDRLLKAQDLEMTPVQISILASIVEAETQKNVEKARIAGVYLNRLKTSMPLQADPTVKFAVGDFALRRILEGHTRIDSPYNTYLNTGLPPGPINLPSTISIDAVLNAEKHNFLYFCASPVNPGFHDFAASYNDHVNNANRYRRFLNNQNIK